MPDRRHLLQAGLGALAASVLPGCSTLSWAPTAQPLPTASTLTRVRPPRLRPGDTVGLFNLSSAATPAQVERATRHLQGLGLQVRLAPQLLARHGHLAGTAEQRADDFHTLWRDPAVRGLWALRGGSGAAAVLPLLDYGLMRRDPKVVVGYSDLTALHVALLRHAGLVAFHGPVATSTPTAFTVDALRRVLMDPQPQTVLSLSPEHQARAAAGEAAFTARSLHAGVAEGRLLGGNLTVLAAALGTAHAPLLADSLLFIEEVHEAPYRLDRLFTQLRQAGVLDQARGVVAGVFDRCQPTDNDPSFTLDGVVDEHLARLGRPAVYGWSFGHVRDQWTLPLGVMARLDTAARTLTLLEAAVS